uniref:Beta-hexosaminidase n=1 Tax=Clastoptera arizonana TaxID=38151 RepID=A0A1B6ED71_9HEMI
MDMYLLLLLLFVNLRIGEGRLSWSWKWTCINRQCIQSKDFSSTSGGRFLDSLDVCRLTCNKFGSLWPKPTGLTFIGNQVFDFNPKIIRFDVSKVSGDEGSNDYIKIATQLFLSNLYKLCGNKCSNTSEKEVLFIRINTTSSNLVLNWNTDESYNLEVVTTDDQVTVQLNAVSVYGARHGLQTLTQLITKYTDKKGKNVLVMAANVTVNDKPAYSHRGLLIDTARNFLPVKTIKRTMEAMAMSKLNVLHWHMTDSQSFPLVSTRVPQLSRFGAYSSREIYFPADISQLIEYGRLRGIRVILEIDAPAHSGNGWQWGQAAGLGDLAVCVNQQPWREFCIQPPCGQLNPANNNIYRVLGNLYKDIIDLMPPEEMFHMGGDEVYFPCWNSSKDITDWMTYRRMGRENKDFIKIWGEYQQIVLKLWDELVSHSNTPIILWSSHLTLPSVIEEYLQKDRYVIETWVEKSDPLPTDLLNLGYRVIIATKDAWYLDHGFWGRTTYHDWKVVYDNRLPSAKKGVLGGEVAMWGELVDEHSLDNKVWPRASAVAERLWSNPITRSTATEYRLIQHRKSLIQKGIDAQAIMPEWCSKHEGECA